jgi:hypothetical protein
LAAMHWNENFNKKVNTYNFLDDLRKEVDSLFAKRRKGRKANNDHKVTKHGIITHWPKKY